MPVNSNCWHAVAAPSKRHVSKSLRRSETAGRAGGMRSVRLDERLVTLDLSQVCSRRHPEEGTAAWSARTNQAATAVRRYA
jgi:hypothetical protein